MGEASAVKEVEMREMEKLERVACTFGKTSYVDRTKVVMWPLVLAFIGIGIIESSLMFFPWRVDAGLCFYGL